MKEQGFSFAIIALMIFATTISLQNTRIQTEKQANVVSTQVLEIEKVTFTRTSMENIFDDLTKTTLENEIKNNNLDAKKIKQKIVERILWLCGQKLFDNNNIEVDFFLQKNESKEQVLQKTLEESTSVLVTTQEGLTIAWFFFTGGINQDTHFKATIKGKNYSTEFTFPQGYTVSAVVAP